MESVEGSTSKDRLYLYVAIFLVFLSIAYWTLFVFNGYTGFRYFDDLSVHYYSMYYNAYHLPQSDPLQFLVIGNHIAPAELIPFLFYLAFQSPLTLLFFQEIVLSLSGLLIFFVSKDLLKNDKIALLLCAAYLVNPGMHALIIYDYHEEFLFIPFYILTFYYYMKADNRRFYLSSLFLVGVMDISVIISTAMAIGLGIYELIEDKDAERRKKRLRLSAALICMAMAALLFYNAVYFTVTAGYASAGMSNYPPVLKLRQFPLVPFNNIANGFTCPSCIISYAQAYGGNTYVVLLVSYGLAVALIGFGLAFAFDLIPTLILISPLLAAIFVFKDWQILSIGAEYLSLFACMMFVATILGLMKLQELKAHPTLFGKDVYKLVVWSAPIIAVTLLIISLQVMSVTSAAPNFINSLFLTTSPSMQKQYEQLNSIISLVPQNSSIFTQGFIWPRFLNRPDASAFGFELYFQPEYILVDFDSNITSLDTEPAQAGALCTYINQNSYELEAQNGSATLLRKINLSMNTTPLRCGRAG